MVEAEEGDPEVIVAHGEQSQCCDGESSGRAGSLEATNSVADTHSASFPIQTSEKQLLSGRVSRETLS